MSGNRNSLISTGGGGGGGGGDRDDSDDSQLDSVPEYLRDDSNELPDTSNDNSDGPRTSGGSPSIPQSRPEPEPQPTPSPSQSRPAPTPSPSQSEQSAPSNQGGADQSSGSDPQGESGQSGTAGPQSGVRSGVNQTEQSDAAADRVADVVDAGRNVASSVQDAGAGVREFQANTTPVQDVGESIREAANLPSERDISDAADQAVESTTGTSPREARLDARSETIEQTGNAVTGTAAATDSAIDRVASDVPGGRSTLQGAAVTAAVVEPTPVGEAAILGAGAAGAAASSTARNPDQGSQAVPDSVFDRPNELEVDETLNPRQSNSELEVDPTLNPRQSRSELGVDPTLNPRQSNSELEVDPTLNPRQSRSERGVPRPDQTDALEIRLGNAGSNRGQSQQTQTQTTTELERIEGEETRTSDFDAEDLVGGPDESVSDLELEGIARAVEQDFGSDTQQTDNDGNTQTQTPRQQAEQRVPPETEFADPETRQAEVEILTERFRGEQQSQQQTDTQPDVTDAGANVETGGQVVADDFGQPGQQRSVTETLGPQNSVETGEQVVADDFGQPGRQGSVTETLGPQDAVTTGGQVVADDFGQPGQQGSVTETIGTQDDITRVFDQPTPTPPNNPPQFDQPTPTPPNNPPRFDRPTPPDNPPQTETPTPTNNPGIATPTISTPPDPPRPRRLPDLPDFDRDRDDRVPFRAAEVEAATFEFDVSIPDPTLD